MTTGGKSSPMNILLAVDGSDHALAAVQMVRELPLPAGSQVTVVGVVEQRSPPGRAALLAASDEAVEILKGQQAEVRTGLLHGDPAEELARFAAEIESDLIVVGAQGLHARLGVFLGGVAHSVVENAPMPVLVVRSPHREVRCALLAYDGSEHSRRAAEFLGRFPLAEVAEVRVMHVLPERAARGGPAAGVPARMQAPLPTPQEDSLTLRQAEAEERAGQEILAEAEAILQEAGIEAETRLARGAPAEQLIRTSDEEGFDLIVAGSRGLSAVQGWLLGSVSRQLVHSAKGPVLIVRSLGEKTE